MFETGCDEIRSVNKRNYWSIDVRGWSVPRESRTLSPAKIRPSLRNPPLRALLASALLFLLTVMSGQVRATPTDVTVSVIAKGGKFVGTTMGGVRIVLRDTATGEVLAAGLTSGSTGDTEHIMDSALMRGEPLSTPAEVQRNAGLPTARFEARIDLDAPVMLRVEATGPLGQPQAEVTVTSEQWVFPGKHITAGDGLLLELPGIAVDVLAPVVSSNVSGEIHIEANVTLLCGCPLIPGGTWDADEHEVTAIISRDTQILDEIPMAYAGTPSRFEVSYMPKTKGPMTITVTAWNRKNGNSGLDRTTVFAD